MDRSPIKKKASFSKMLLNLLSTSKKPSEPSEPIKRIYSFDSIASMRDFQDGKVSTLSVPPIDSQMEGLDGNRSPKRQNEPKQPGKIIDEKSLLFEKIDKYLISINTPKRKMIVFHEENPNPFTSLIHSELKLTKYSQFFEEYIIVKPFKKKSEERVKINLTTHIRRKTNDGVPNFVHFAICALIKHGVFKSVVTTCTKDLFRNAGVCPENLFELYGNGSRFICKSCKSAQYEVTTDCIKCKGALELDLVEVGKDVKRTTFQLILNQIKESTHSLVVDSSMHDESFANLPTLFNQTLAICTTKEIPRKFREVLISSGQTQLCAYSEDLLITLLEHYKISI